MKGISIISHHAIYIVQLLVGVIKLELYIAKKVDYTSHRAIKTAQPLFVRLIKLKQFI